MNLKKLLVLTGLTACCAAGAAAETAAPLTEPLTAAEASSVGNVGAIEKVSPPKRLEGRSEHGKELSPLMLAAQGGNAEQIARLRAGGADVNAADRDGWTPLMLALCAGEGTTAAEALLAAGADVNARNKERWTPLMLALRSDKPAAFIARLLTQYHALASPECEDGTTAMMIACQFASDPTVVETLYAADADAVQPRRGGDCPIHFAVRNSTDGASGIVSFLLNNRAEVNQTNDAGWTPLMTAARFNTRLDVVAALLSAGADVDARNRDGLTALMLAAASEAPTAVAIAKKLLDAGADVEKADRFGRTAALVAMRSAHSVEMVRFLDRELTPRSVARQTAVLAVLPVSRTVKECARLVSARDERVPLSAHRVPRRAASPAFVNKASGRSPQPAGGQKLRFIEAPALAVVSQSARLLSRPALQAARTRASADLSASVKRRRLQKLNAALKRDPARVTPLMLAAVNPNAAAPEIIAYLLEKGEALEAKDGEGRTPLICAVRYNPSPLAAEALLNAGADPRATINGNGLRRLLRFNERMSPQDKKRLLRLLREKPAR